MNIKKFNVENFDKEKNIILFGAGNLGILTIEALKKFKIKPNFFYDNNLKKQNKIFYNLKILDEKKFKLMDKESIIILCNNYIDATLDFLKKYGFNNIYDVSNILINHDFKINELLKIQENNLHFGAFKAFIRL